MNLRDELRAVLDNTVIDEMFEPTARFALTSACAKIMNAPVCIWTDTDVTLFVRLFKGIGLKVHKVVSVSPKKFNSVDDTPIVMPSDIVDDPAPNKFFFVNSTDYDEKNVGKIYAFLQSLDTTGVYVLTKYDWEKIAGHEKSPFDLNRIEYYQSHKDELMQCFEQLADDRSKQTLIDYLQSYMTNSPYRGEQTPTRYKYFFGAKDELLYKHLDNECWINCGSSIGDTLFLFFGWGLKAKKIYAFEGGAKNFQELLNNLSFLTPELRSMVEPINEMINEQTDFESILKDGGGRCTLLNADIEGNELALLKSMRDVIYRDRPVMAICVYHLKEDLVEIPAFFRETCEDYVYYLRKYNTGWLQNYKRNHELVMYAVPRERSLIECEVG